MEKINFSNGTEKSFITNENDTYKFYACDGHQEATELIKHFSDKGVECNIAFNNRYGWYVRIKK